MGKLNPFAKPKTRVNFGQLNNRPLGIVHNHNGAARIVYAGFSERAPDQHLFRCEAFSEPPRKIVMLSPFVAQGFLPESKAGRGGCSMRKCPGDAVKMNADQHKAYCLRCSQRVTGIEPCSWTSVELCGHKWGLDEGDDAKPCPMCAPFEPEEVT